MTSPLAEAITGNILVVDDMPVNLRLLGDTLTARGHRVRTVSSGSQAITSALAELPDLILLDIRMPEMDGFEVCRLLKANERTRAVPIIFISALGELEDKMLAFQAGGVDYITKPFRVEEVLARTDTHLALRRLQVELETRNRRLEREMTLAGKVQASFLPHQLVPIQGWDLAACLHPARATSGDFYDVFVLPGGKVGLLIADVVDKGVPAALLMAMSWALLCSTTSQGIETPEMVFRRVNQTLVEHLDGLQFLTAFLGILEPAAGCLTYSNAGHPPPLLIGRDAGKIAPLRHTGPPLGVLETATWEQRTTDIPAGDAVLLYTDGVTEAERKSDFYGPDRLTSTVRRLWPCGPSELIEGVFNDVRNFSAGSSPSDDIALLAVARLP